ncbi:unnamed protein product [Scytosiphon promiscuus]
MNGASIPTAEAAAIVTSAPVPTTSSSSNQNLEHGQRDTHLPPAAVDVDIGAPSKWGGQWWFIFSLGMFFLLAGLAQVLLAAIIREKEIEVIDIWFGDTFYPLAGDPYVGLLSLCVAFCFIFRVGCDRDMCGGRKGCFEFGAFAIFFLCVILSFGERAVYRKLTEYDECVEVTGNYILYWDLGDCVCLEDGFSWEVDPDDDGFVGSQGVNVDISSSTSCGQIMSYVDDILASYALMNILIVLIVLVAFFHCIGMASFPAGPQNARTTVDTAPAAATTVVRTDSALYVVYPCDS